MIDAILTNILTVVITNKPVLIAAGYSLALGIALWALWITLNVAYARKKRFFYAVLLWVLAIPGLLLDVLFQITVATVLFWELPKEWTLSMRLTRYLAGRSPDKTANVDYGYRVKLAEWIARNLVEPWARDHIGLERFGYQAPRDAMKWLLKRLP